MRDRDAISCSHSDDQADGRGGLFPSNLSRVLRIADDLRGRQALDRNGRKLVILNPQPLVAKALELGGINEVAVIVHDPFRGAPHGSLVGRGVGTNLLETELKRA